MIRDFIKYKFFIAEPGRPLRFVRFKRFMRKLFNIQNSTPKTPKLSIEFMMSAIEQLPSVARTLRIVEQRRREEN